MSIAISYDDEEMVRLIFNFYLRSREKKVENNNKNLVKYLTKMRDMYIELRWKVTVPIFSFLCPNDTIQIWKRGNEVRGDFTFVDYKTLRNIRRPTTLMLKYNKEKDCHEIFKANHEKKEYYNYMEPKQKNICSN